MANHIKNIDGYLVELDTDMDGDGKTTGCWIILQRQTFSASLEALKAEGCLTRIMPYTGEAEHKVEQATIDRIEAWAIQNGY